MMTVLFLIAIAVFIFRDKTTNSLVILKFNGTPKSCEGKDQFIPIREETVDISRGSAAAYCHKTFSNQWRDLVWKASL